jgi:hypothetical protein
MVILLNGGLIKQPVMNTFSRYLIILLAIGAICVSCGKDSGAVQTGQGDDDPGLTIRNRNWWGLITVPGQQPGYYSAHFTADSAVIWNQLEGEYDGKWSMNGTRITINLNGINAMISADVSGDGTFANIQDNYAGGDVNTGNLVKHEDFSLDNTEWQGKLSDLLSGNDYVMDLKFLPDLKADISLGGVTEHPGYDSNGSAAFFRTDDSGVQYFGVFVSADSIRGNRGDVTEKFALVKK